MSTPPAAWKLRYDTPSRPSTRAARPTVVGMSCSLRSQNTRNPRSREGFDRRRARGGVQLEPDLRDAEPGCDLARELHRVGRESGRRATIARWSRAATSSFGCALGCSSQASDQFASRARRRSRAHHASISRTIRSGARGSANVAVPTPTAVAPASIISIASTPVVTPPVPMIGTPGNARDTSHTARNAIGLIGAPVSPPPPAPSRGVRACASIEQTHHRVDEREPGRARVERGGRDRDDVGDVGRELRERRHRVADRLDDRAHRGARRVLGVREHVAARFDVGTREVHLDARSTDPRPPSTARAAVGVLLDGASPDRRDHARAARFERGKIVLDPRVDARTGQARPS